MSAPRSTSTGSDPVAVALSRSLLYRELAATLRYPSAGSAAASVAAAGALRRALLESESRGIEALVRDFASAFATCDDAGLEAEHVRLFGHTVRGALPCYETEYGTGNDALLQAHELADLAAFYEVAGLRPRAGERVDSIALECELMQYLARKEAHALEHEDARQATAIKDLQRAFLESHLGRWGPAWMRRLGEEEGPLGTVGRLGEAWLAEECVRFDLSLAAESLSLRVPLMGPDDVMSCATAPTRPKSMEV